MAALLLLDGLLPASDACCTAKGGVSGRLALSACAGDEDAEVEVAAALSDSAELLRGNSSCRVHTATVVAADALRSAGTTALVSQGCGREPEQASESAAAATASAVSVMATECGSAVADLQRC